MTPWLRGFNPWVCVDIAGSEFPTLEGLMSRCAAAGGFYSARRAWSYTSALSRKCLPPREGLHARLGFGGHGFSRTGRCRCVPCAQQRDRQCRAGSCTGGWQGLAITQAVPRNQPLLEGWDETLQKGPFPLAGGHCLARLLPGPGEGKAAPELWEQELVGVPKRRVQPRRGVRKGGKTF